jgi:hypothetical protein
MTKNGSDKAKMAWNIIANLEARAILNLHQAAKSLHFLEGESRRNLQQRCQEQYRRPIERAKLILESQEAP